MNRRAWLVSSGLMAIGSRSIFGALPFDDAALESARKRAKEAGIGPLREQESEHYRGIGDAPAEFQKDALKLCDGLAGDFLSHFQKKQFDAALPAAKMLVVVLKGPNEFAAFLNVAANQAVGGVFDVDEDRLVVFDNRARPGAGRAGKANTVSLFHEATHQLCYHTGLLRRDGDVPLCINEGLGVYGETRSVNGQKKIGEANRERFPELKTIGKAGGPTWLNVSRLFVEDDLFDGKDQVQAYGQAWLLVHHLLKTPARTPQFRDYLKAIAPRKDATHRLDDAEAAFGDLVGLDKELKSALAKVLKS